MAKDNRGHKPHLKMVGAEKWDRCDHCDDEKRRGADWKRQCPGPMVKAKLRMPTT